MGSPRPGVPQTVPRGTRDPKHVKRQLALKLFLNGFPPRGTASPQNPLQKWWGKGFIQDPFELQTALLGATLQRMIPSHPLDDLSR